MNKFRVSLSLAVLSSISLLIPIHQRAIALELNTSESQEVNKISASLEDKQQTNVAETAISDVKPIAVSYSSADLKPQVNNSIASRPVDIDEFCKSFPYNSRCQDRAKPASPSEETKPAPEANEQPKSESAAKTSGWAITPEIGTLGLGASVTKSVTPNLNARVGVNAFSYGIDLEETDVKYKADLNLLNVSTLVDYHPFKNSGFRLTGGVVFNNNKVEGNAQARNNQEFEFNGNTYNTSQIGSAKAKVSLPNSVAPATRRSVIYSMITGCCVNVETCKPEVFP
jgi:hypothetical protein